MELTRYTLDNGMTVILQPMRTAPVVACNVWVRVGSADEEPAEAGLAHVHEHMLFKGTERRKVGEIAREIEASGGHINAFTSFDQTCYYVVMSSRYFDNGLDILSDAVRNSSFDEEELGRELEVIQEEIKRSEDSPSRVATLQLFQTAYERHPYRLPVIGTSESVDSFTRDHVVNFFNKHYVPSNMAVVLAGDFELEEAKEKVERYFGDFQGPGYQPVEREREPEQKSMRSFTEQRDIQQSHLRIGFHVPEATHEDIPAIDLLSVIMGYGDASHLTQTIERELELVNSIYSSSYNPKEAGLYMVMADYQLQVDGASHQETTRAILEETFRFREMRVSDVDLKRASTIMESQQIYSKQTIQGLAMKIGHYETVTGDPEFERRYYEALAALRPEDIQRAAKKYLHPSNCSLVLVHPAEEEAVSTQSLETEVGKAFEIISAEALDTAIKADSEGFARIELPDGPTVIVQEDPTVATFAARALVMGGLRYETPENNGINRLLSSMMTEGTHRRTSVEIAREIESMASSVDGISGRNSFGMAMNGLTRFFEPCFDIFSECIFGSTIPDDEFRREKKLQIQDIKARRDQLGSVNHRQFSAAFFAPHPYQMSSLGEEASLEKLEAEAARDYLDALIHPRDMALVVVGDVETEHVVQLAERYFVRPESGHQKEPQLEEPRRREEPVLITSDLEKQQAHILVGFPAPTLHSSQTYATELLYAILSGQGGRLFYELRDRQSLAYSVYASMVPGLDASAFTIGIGTSPEKIDQAIRGILTEVDKLRENSLDIDELERAKRYLIGNHDIGLQRNSSRAMTFGLDELYDLGYKRSLKYGDYISSVTIDDLHGLIADYFDPTQMVISVVKPAGTDVKFTF
ncbi:MAG: M16 family metallopeptidase [Bradymonadaceae bacterium]